MITLLKRKILMTSSTFQNDQTPHRPLPPDLYALLQLL